MGEIKAKTVDDQLVKIPAEALEGLKSKLRGELLVPGDEEYQRSIEIWNKTIDRHPAFIVRCLGTADVILAVRFAKEHHLLISVKGAGHNVAGRSLADNVFLIDLSNMRYVHVDPVEQTAEVSAGSKLSDVEHETQIYGLAVPVGINSTTGIAGLTLGGGFGWLSRKLGMTIDNLLSAEIITVNGDRIVCNKDQNSDIFWAIRGGGGNFGIITSFKYKLSKVGPIVYGGPVVFDLKDGKNVLEKYREFCKNSPDSSTLWTVIRICPPLPFVDPSYVGKPVLILVALYVGAIEEGKRLYAKIPQISKVVGNGLGEYPFEAFQKLFDPLLAPRARNYWKTHNFKEISDELINTLLENGAKLPNNSTEMFIAQMGGQTNQIPKEATAYPYRNVNFIMNVHTRWEEEVDDEKCITWARKFYEATKPFSMGGAYVNFVSEGDDSLELSYSENSKKLSSIKAKYDPKNVLRFNLNIPPNQK